jgi:hypothetical protein
LSSTTQPFSTFSAWNELTQMGVNGTARRYGAGIPAGAGRPAGIERYLVGGGGARHQGWRETPHLFLFREADASQLIVAGARQPACVTHTDLPVRLAAVTEP